MSLLCSQHSQGSPSHSKIESSRSSVQLACSLLHPQPILISSAPDSCSGGHAGLSAVHFTLTEFSCSRSLHPLLLSASLPLPTPSWPRGCFCSFRSSFCSCHVLMDTFPEYRSPIIFFIPLLCFIFLILLHSVFTTVFVHYLPCNPMRI